MNRRTLAFALVFILAATLHAGVVAGESRAIGRLTVNGHASLESGATTLELAEGTHPYFAGDRIVAGGDGAVTLTLRSGAVTLDPGSAVRVQLEKFGPRIWLERGMAHVQLPPSSGFQLDLGPVSVRARQLDARELEPAPIDLVASFDPELGAVVGCRSGALETFVSGAAAGQPLAVSETRSFALHPPSAIADVCAAPDEEKDEPLSERTRMLALRAAGVAGLVGVGFGVNELVDDDDDDSPASPTN